MAERDDILLMTATITPAPGTFLLRHVDPAQRLNDYREALRFYLGELEAGTFARIIFAENSNSDIAELATLARDAGLADRVTFVGVAPGPVGQHSRFFLELDLLKKAFATAALASVPGRTMMWKVTGRYIVRNIGAIVRTAPPLDVYVNSRNHPRKFTDFYLAAFRKDVFAPVLGDRIDDYDTHATGEEILRHQLDARRGGPLSIGLRMRHVPTLEGTRGYDQMRYGGLGYRAKSMVRALLNRWVPGLWI
ncbi:hypothetical protein [Sphingomonas bacterium]|uniref:hypothetical protein n=1 Tax=Sphingomonas bacterium TaxID=1895847 RepID=UPI0015765E3E|nr:hypothetical protein [Sphingomonas bacterium]